MWAFFVLACTYRDDVGGAGNVSTRSAERTHCRVSFERLLQPASSSSYM